jgi:hypothetical protein
MSVEDEIERVRRDELVVAGVATTEPEAAVACGLTPHRGDPVRESRDELWSRGV